MFSYQSELLSFHTLLHLHAQLFHQVHETSAVRHSKVREPEFQAWTVLLNKSVNPAHNSCSVRLWEWFLTDSLLWSFQYLFCKNRSRSIHYIPWHVLRPAGYTVHQSQGQSLILSSNLSSCKIQSKLFTLFIYLFLFFIIVEEALIYKYLFM